MRSGPAARGPAAPGRRRRTHAVRARVPTALATTVRVATALAATAHVVPALAATGRVATALAVTAHIVPALAVTALAAASLTAACGRPGAPAVVEVTAPARTGLDLAHLRWEPPELVARAELDGAGRLVLVVDARRARLAPALQLRHPEACPAEVSVAPGRTSALELRPWLDVTPDQAQAGLGAPFEVLARPGCPEAAAGEVTWRQLEGPPPAELSVDRGGRRLRGRTLGLRQLWTRPLPWGLVPFSPATRGEHVFEATWRGPGHADVRRLVRVAAVARASGLPSVGVNTRVVLAGEGWQMRARPPDSRALLAPVGGATTLAPDVTGRWILVAPDGDELQLQASRHDETPLDCGRVECHPAAHDASFDRRMTVVLPRALEGALGPAHDPRCALACHAVGEPGVADGGFAHVADELGHAVAARGRPGGWGALPRDLRRLGGVTCGGCHGPGAIPERAARWSILRSDVCAVCHDAPPRYTHVRAWALSRMARADATPGTREGACAECHTTAGFLAARGVRAILPGGVPPLAAGPVGVSCPACHAVHGEGIDRHLLRRVRLPSALAGAPATLAGASTAVAGAPPAATEAAGVCLPCHAPRAGDAVPSASAAALWLGRGGVRIATGEPLPGPAGHAASGVDCIDCHAGPPPGTPRAWGSGHAFRSDRPRCALCHAADAELEERRGADGRLVAERASALWARLGDEPAAADGAPAEGPRHARAPQAALSGAAGSAPSAPPVDPARARARWNVLLVLEDPAAGVHNAPYARLLLDEVEAYVTPRPGAARAILGR